MHRLPLRFPLSALAVIALVAMAIILPTAFGASAPAPAPVRKALAQTEQVQGAPGRTMVLSQVTVAVGCPVGEVSATVLLVRPDGYVAWASSAAAPGVGELSELRRVLAQWFGL